ncbi:MAG TPA: TerD family protein [Alphaproteobacteria bacterium]|nr:TerD family protein [Alphaproteobacteria bacterium]HNS44683.1 TerD family protein [Alphaproteobacteria bacterium]
MSDVEITRSSVVDIMGDENESFKLKRGEQVNLTRLDPTLRRIMVGVGWDVVGFESEAPDLDLSIFLLDRHEQTRMDEDFIFYNNLKSLEGAVEHMGDNRTGAGDGDDENALVDLMSLPFEVNRVAFVISIYEADTRNHNFQSVRNIFLRVVNDENGIELMRFNLDQEFTESPNATAVIVGFLERNGPNWFFEGTGAMSVGGLKEIATGYGIVVAY